MSYAIFDLHLEMPPITVARQDSAWVARCEVCNYVSPRRPRLSSAVKDQQRHGRGHSVLHMLRPPTRRFAAPVDAVHLDEGVA